MSAYRDFLNEVGGGPFDPPEAGWSAEQIVAHVARNHESLIAVTERVLAGYEVTFDNHEAISDAELNAYVESYGGLRGLGDRLAQTVAVLCDLRGQLDERGQTQVAVHLVDGDQVAIDQPMPWAKVLDLDESVHVPGHLKQLRALRRK